MTGSRPLRADGRRKLRKLRNPAVGTSNYQTLT
jgi:hypothetical protein